MSRQREFLADASAVQFTRFPDGIAGALKKIGGLALGSRLRHRAAEEASHMFFGNGLRTPFLELLATHPPLGERIRRIDPTFDGTLSRGGPDPIHERRTWSTRTRWRPAAGRASTARPWPGRRPLPTIRPPRWRRSARRGRDISIMPPICSAALPLEIAAAVHDPLGAVATVYALLLDDDQSEMRRAQLDYLATKADPKADAETRRVVPFAARVAAEMKLPLVGLVLPALKGLSPVQLASFRDDVLFLIQADKKVSLFEYAVHRLILKRLVERLDPRPGSETKIEPTVLLGPLIGGLLSTLAWLGTRDDEQSRRAFTLGTQALGPLGNGVTLVPRERAGLQAGRRGTRPAWNRRGRRSKNVSSRRAPPASEPTLG